VRTSQKAARSIGANRPPPSARYGLLTQRPGPDPTSQEHHRARRATAGVSVRSEAPVGASFEPLRPDCPPNPVAFLTSGPTGSLTRVLHGRLIPRRIQRRRTGRRRGILIQARPDPLLDNHRFCYTTIESSSRTRRTPARPTATGTAPFGQDCPTSSPTCNTDDSRAIVDIAGCTKGGTDRSYTV
jgi:hypothetical protein